jgi:hypothetical protein
MHHNHNRLIKKSSKSLAKWKRDAEAWYKQDTAMFEGLFRKAEANVVRLFLMYCYTVDDLNPHTISSA